MKREAQKKKGRYQIKKEAGLVPHVYDRDSRSFMEGAWKNWPHNRDKVTRRITWTQPEEDRNAKADRDALVFARERR